jgi:hypothetical protein
MARPVTKPEQYFALEKHPDLRQHQLARCLFYT